jgi:tight adherence protein C
MLTALAAVFLSVAFVSGAIAVWVLNRTAPDRRRLRQVIDTGATNSMLLGPGTPMVDRQAARDWTRVEKILPKSPKEMSLLRRRLQRAGYRHLGAAVLLAVAELVLPVLFAGTAIAFIPKPQGWIFAGLAGVVGFLVPGLWLERATEARKRAIRNGLPDALDLLVVCLEAGSSLDQGLVKAGAELEIAYPDLAYELQTIITETRAGKTRLEAFKNFSERTKVEEVRALTAMLVQTDRFGTSISQALRAHSETVRVARRQAAEERAAKVSVKLVFPLVLFLFPALYVIILGSALLDFLRVFSTTAP